MVAVARASDVTELEIGNGAFHVRLRREPTAPTAVAESAPPIQDINNAGLHRVTAPFTGVFYRSATPTARAYVEVGDWVDANAVIGLVETMKIFNEVTADVAGRITSFQAENGQLVHAGDGLVLIEPGERAAGETEEPRL